MQLQQQQQQQLQQQQVPILMQPQQMLYTPNPNGAPQGVLPHHQQQQISYGMYPPPHQQSMYLNQPTMMPVLMPVGFPTHSAPCPRTPQFVGQQQYFQGYPPQPVRTMVPGPTQMAFPPHGYFMQPVQPHYNQGQGPRPSLSPTAYAPGGFDTASRSVPRTPDAIHPGISNIPSHLPTHAVYTTP